MSILTAILVFDAPITLVGRSIGTTLYVNSTGSGGAYTSIQAAVDNASVGDTVYIYSGTYIEKFVVDKSINVIGYDRDSTIINGAGAGTVVNIIADWVNITDLSIINGGQYVLDAGVMLDNVNNCTVSNLYFSDNERCGINIYDEQSKYNTIKNCVFTDNDRGIYIHESSNNKILNNNISNNKYGVHLWDSSYIYFANNKFVNDGLYIQGQVYSPFNSLTISDNNTVNGKPILYYKDVNRIEIDGIEVGQLILANCEDVIVTNLRINNSDVGIGILDSKEISVINNNISDNYYGIYLRSANNIYITNNKFFSNDAFCILSEYGSNYYVQNNDMIDNGNAIRFESTIDNVIVDNTIIEGGGGIYLVSGSSGNYVSNNKFSNNSKGIHLASSRNTVTSNKILSSSFYGIKLTESHNNLIANNIASDCDYGIHLIESSNNSIINNNLSFNNDYGIFLNQSSDNIFYHNNLINNTFQAYDDSGDNLWNNSYPSGGNYWSDWTTFDDYGGANQNQPGNDGIVDKGLANGGGLKPYILEIYNRDNYPLTEPYIDLEAPQIQLLSPLNNSIIRGGTILDFNFYEDNLGFECNYSINGEPELTFYELYNISTSGWSDGEYIIQISAIDIVGNTNLSWFFFTIYSEPPIINELITKPNPQEIHNNLNISVDASDIGLIYTLKANITDPDDDIMGNFTMTFNSIDNRYYLNQSYDKLGSYTYVIWAQNDQNKWNYSTGYFSIQDTTPPIVNAGMDHKIVQGIKVNFNASYSSDNFKINNYTWNFIYNNKTISLYEMNPTFTFVLTGNYTVSLNVTDSSGNYAIDTLWVNVVSVDTDNDGLTNYEEEHIYGTDPKNPDSDWDGINDGDEIINGTDPKVAEPKEKPKKSNITSESSWILIILVVITILILVLVLLTMRKRKKSNDELTKSQKETEPPLQS